MNKSLFTILTGQWGLALFVATIFATGLFWAKARDPFKRIKFSLTANGGQKVSCMAVLPKTAIKRPTVIWLHGSEGNLINDGNQLRQLAELGLNSVGIEYDKADQNNFAEQFSTLNHYLNQQSWAKSNAVAWIGQSLGAQMTLVSLLRHPNIQPQLYVRMAGGWVSELNSNVPIGIQCKVLLLHGRGDEVFPEADCLHLAALLRSNGVPVSVHVFRDGQPHGFGPDQPVIVRGVAEYCASLFFGSLQPLAINTRPSYWYYWLPVFVLALVLGANSYAHRRILLKNLPDPYPRASKAILAIAWLLSTGAVALTTIHLGLPQLSASKTTVNLTRKWIVQPAQRSNFDWLTEQPFSQRQKINTLLQHLELAELQRSFFYPDLDIEIYRNFVLSPVIAPSTLNPQPSTDLNWRRELWENFYPRVRHETDAASAAQIVVRFLRERVTIAPGVMEPAGVDSIWRTEMTDTNGFEVIYVAALRSVGIAARLDSRRQAEFWNGGGWQSAPRPVLETWLDFGR